MLVTGISPARIGRSHPVAETRSQIVLGDEEHLRDGVLGPGAELSDEHLGVLLERHRARMAVGERRGADTEVTGGPEQLDKL
jgi:hypothetical protein